MPVGTTLKVLGNELTVRWEIPKFSCYQIAHQKIQSQSFSSCPECCDEWSLSCYPLGNRKKSCEYVSIYLHASTKITAFFELSILDENQCPKLTNKEDKAHCFDGVSAWGFEDFAKRKDVLCLLYDDTLTISCSINIVLPETPQICLKANKQAKYLAKDLEKLLLQPDFKDVDICVEGQPLPAHKCILAARSPVFEAMFNHNNSKCKIVITDLECDVVKEMLQYIYTGRSNRIKETAERLFFAAEEYQLCNLKMLCEEAMVWSISVENVCRLFLFSIDHNLPLLKASASDFASEYMECVMKTCDFDRIITTNPEIIKQIFCEYIQKNKC